MMCIAWRLNVALAKAAVAAAAAKLNPLFVCPVLRSS